MNVKKENQDEVGAGEGPAPARRSQAERSQATRGALVDAARPLFAERGYAEVGTEEIVRAAGVTRGALYHHFDGKRELFEAVYEQIEAELAERIAAGALNAGAAAPLDAMRAGAEMFLRECTEREVQQIALLDGPSVLGWDRWREIGAEHGLGLIEATLQAAIDADAIAAQPVRPLAHVLMGALDEAAMLVARAEDPEAARAEVGRTIDSLLVALSSS
jgi:AcrR family transcriptional regulator